MTEYKARLDLIPWDVCTVVDVDIDRLVVAAKMWWVREIPTLPCAVPHALVHGVGHVLDMGAQKYSERGWENDARFHTASGHFRSLMRHAFSEHNDAESGLPHEFHAACRYMMLSALCARGVLIDDRPAQVLRADEVMQPRDTFVTKGGES